jgi:hypothetical protein
MFSHMTGLNLKYVSGGNRPSSIMWTSVKTKKEGK